MISGTVKEEDVNRVIKYLNIDLSHLNTLKRWLIGLHKSELSKLINLILNHDTSSTLLKEIQIYNELSSQNSNTIHTVVQSLIEIMYEISYQYETEVREETKNGGYS